MHDNTYNFLQDAGIVLVLLSIVAGLTMCAVSSDRRDRDIQIERVRAKACPCPAEAPAK